MRNSTFLLLTLGLLIAPRIALAASFDEVAAEGGFYLVDNIPFETAHMKTAIRAVPRFNSERTGTRCSAVILSNTGYVATNIHCLADAKSSVLVPRWGMEPNVKTSSSSKKGYYSVFRVEERTPDVKWTPLVKSYFNLDNYLWSSDKKRIAPIEMVDYGMDEVQVVWLGKGQQTHNEHLINELSREEVDALVDASQDIAILKYDVKGNKADVPCLPLAKSRARPGDAIWAIGHPARNKRENGMSSPGNSLAVSIGKVRATIEQDPIYQRYASEMNAEQALSFWEKEKEIFEQDHLLLSSADVYGGNSGGAFINEDGELVAISYSVSKSNEAKYEGATSFSVRAEHIREWLTRDLGAAKAQEIFACQR